MDQVTTYRETVREILTGLQKEYYNQTGPIKATLIQDDRNGHYLITIEGWEGERFTYGTSIHVEVKADGKVWIHRNSSSVIIIDHLERAGIPMASTVVAWHPPLARKHTEFAEG
ncbi:element excision factor XisI family protein [Neolewinella antarctica]|uniref:XisI protein n=1 Tax=Neolewinella antarctica TaxID=442734 RepID=A0ABX0XFQ3_9BACT|nr:element excision factor XisI family protein [Neolewinella antarctica]NJC28150.1 hypothetical protein [Neolewinella antarctica]